MEPFLPADTPLLAGTTLIEASAGTGKTFAIASLVLRFVLEERIPIGRILAVTYTIAATAELRDRVRKRLRSALDDLRTGKSDDEIVTRFLLGNSVKQGIADLDAAVQNFDEARIHTIHGFCQRVLGENAFESGSLFDMEMLADPRYLIDEVARDFWRARFYAAPPLVARLAQARKKTHKDFAALLNGIRNHPDIRILPGPDGEDCATLAARLESAFKALAAAWKHDRDAVALILREDNGLSRAADAFKNPDEILESLDTVMAGFESEPPAALLAISRLSPESMAAQMKSGKPVPRHSFFDLCGDFSALVRRYFDRLTHEFIGYAAIQMPARKERLSVTTYDDLLTRVRDALRSGGEFAALLRGKFRVALIDEFQDTDPVQYEIFHTIFGGGGHYLYFIGDPKQAIYGFRGADVFTYIEAAMAASRRFTLGTNWRSEKRLLGALNLFFAKSPPFGNGIEYRPVAPPEKPRAGFAPLTGADRESRLRFRYLCYAENAKGITQGVAEEIVNDAVVADIARLHASGAKLGGRPVRFGDMAVLVRTNKEAARMQEMLRARGIKSVLKTDKSVFRSGEAGDLALLLDGILEPGRGQFLNTALTSRLIGLTPAEIAALEADEPARRAMQEKFLAWRGLWEGGCFIAMFRALLVEQRARERIVRGPGGERALTNFLHLAELLHQQETARQLAPAALRLWLGSQIRSEETVEEHQLRLESDGDGVLIATIHKSKGLEYPVVFCPFLWKSGDNVKQREILFHDPEAGNRLTLDLRPQKEAALHDAAAARENMEESMRKLYVALTRAQNLCYVYAGDIKDFGKSPLAKVIGEDTPQSTLDALAGKSAGAIDITPIDPEADAVVSARPAPKIAPVELQPAVFNGTIPQTHMIASFSGLISDSPREEGEVERDAFEAGEPDAGEETFTLISRFERGTRSGLFWHDLLEHLDFQAPEKIAPLVAEKLVSHGVPAFQAGAVEAQLRNLLAAPLKPGLALEQIAMAERLEEVEFSHPLALPGAAPLRAAFARHGGANGADFSGELGRIEFRPIEGFMRGFIDMIFRHEGRYYIVDWKSNWLGNHHANYEPGALDAVMRHSFYFLQYHLYTVATDLFLRRRVPDYQYDSHFGGVFYLFLRGVDPARPGHGVFHARPAAALIGDLRETLTGRRA